MKTPVDGSLLPCMAGDLPALLFDPPRGSWGEWGEKVDNGWHGSSPDLDFTGSAHRNLLPSFSLLRSQEPCPSGVGVGAGGWIEGLLLAYTF